MLSTPEPTAVISLKRTVGSFGIVIGPSFNVSKSKKFITTKSIIGSAITVVVHKWIIHCFKLNFLTISSEMYSNISKTGTKKYDVPYEYVESPNITPDKTTNQLLFFFIPIYIAKIAHKIKSGNMFDSNPQRDFIRCHGNIVNINKNNTAFLLPKADFIK